MVTAALGYCFRVHWSAADEKYVGLCVEFPLLSWLDSTWEKALIGIVKLVGDIVFDMQQSGEQLPDVIYGDCEE